MRETTKRDKGLLKIIETIEANLSRRNRLSVNSMAILNVYYILSNINMIEQYIV